MLTLALILLFAVCVAIAAGAISIGQAHTTTYSTPFHRHYFYYLIAFYTFAVYGLWGHIVGRLLLEALDSGARLADTIAGFLSVLGVPILFVSWLMLIDMAHSMFGRATRQGWLALHGVVLVLAACGAWIAFADPVTAEADGGWLSARIVAATIGLELLYFALFLSIALGHARESAGPAGAALRRFALLMAAAFALRAALIPLPLVEPYAIPVVVVYFASNLMPLLYLRAVNDAVFEPVAADPGVGDHLDRIVERYGITKRERQIIEQICSGKTNQQIADTLFIGLQTVKDHTHRIYTKLGIRNRIQLVQSVGGGR